MKSPVIINLIFSIILAVVAYFALPSSMFTANAAIAAGILFGGIIIPLLVNLFNTPSGSDAPVNTSSTTLYVGNLPYRANEQAVKEHFALQGRVHSVRLMKDRRTGKRKGYGFVEISSKDADKAIRSLNDSEFQERTLKVRLAKDKVTDE
jgi:RNA recognition motif-containing protein